MNNSSNYNQPIEEQPNRPKSFLNSAQNIKVFLCCLATGIIALTVWCGLQIPNLNTHYAIDQFFPKTHNLVEQDKKIRRTFGLNDNPSILFELSLPSGTWLTSAGVNNLESISNWISQLDRTQAILSLTSIEGASTQNGNLVVGSIFKQLPPEQWASYALGNPLLHPVLIAQDLKSTLILVEPKNSSPREIQEFAKLISTKIQSEIPEAEVHVGGVPAIQYRLNAILLDELSLFLALAVLGFCGVFYFLFRHFTSIALASLSLLITNTCVLGVLAFSQMPFSVILSTLPILVSIAVMSLLIHTLHLWSERRLVEQDFVQRFHQSLDVIKELALPNFLGSLTTAIGFVTLGGSAIPVIQQYGLIVASSIMFAWLVTQLTFVAFLQFTKPVMRSWFRGQARWTKLAFRRSGLIVTSLLVISVICAMTSPFINFSARLFDDLPRKDVIRTNTESIDNHFGGIVTYDLVIQSPTPDFWKEPENLKKLQSIGQELRRLDGIGSVLSLPDLFQGGIPEKKSLVAETFFLYSMAEKNPLQQFVTESADLTRVMVRFRDRRANDIANLRTQIVSSFSSAFPGAKVEEGGIAVNGHVLNQEVARHLVFGFWESMAIIGLLLLVVFRSIRWAVVACIPNLIPPAVLMGLLAAFQTPVKPGVALIFSIALGLAFNNTVYLLGRLRVLYKQTQRYRFSLRQAFLAEGNPCLFESVVMASGFAAFLSSSFSLNQTFGVYMVLSVIAGFLGDLFFLPAILNLFPRLLVRSRDLPSWNQNPVAVTASSIVAAFLILTVSSPVSAASAADILRKTRLKLMSKDDQANVEMQIIEANGSKKTRKMNIKTMRKDGFYALVRMESPADVKGMGFLSHSKGDEDSQWIYSPASGEVRRVVGSSGKGGVLGSELTPDDLDPVAARESQVKVLNTDKDFLTLEIRTKQGTSPYSHIHAKVSAKDFLLYRAEYFMGDKMVKSVDFKDYVKIGTVWRAKSIQVRNPINGRGTDLVFSDMRVNAGLTERQFTQSALKD